MNEMELGTKIKSIKSADRENFSITLVYTDRFKGTVSLKHIFSPPRGVAEDVIKGNFFEKCFIENGALAWANGLELCPDAIRMWIREQKSKKTA
jgi:hypothetical protein